MYMCMDNIPFFNKSVVDLIKIRRSVRTYDTTKKIEREKIDLLKDVLEERKTDNYRFELVEFHELKDKKEKLGTYGFIKGAFYFLIGIIREGSTDRKSLSLAFGQDFEKIILKATDLELGTCWMVSTYNKNQLMKKISLDENEHIVIVSPLGYSTNKRLVEKFMRWVPKSNKRKPWRDLFFINNLETPLTEQKAKEYKVPLEMLRLAPSAANTQPWRVVKIKKNFDLYIVRDSRGDRHKIDCNINDAGIAMSHFELTANELGLKGRWEKDETFEKKTNDKIEYVSTWKTIK